MLHHAADSGRADTAAWQLVVSAVPQLGPALGGLHAHGSCLALQSRLRQAHQVIWQDQSLCCYRAVSSHPGLLPGRSCTGLPSATAQSECCFALQFLLRQVDPHIKAFGKIEDDVPTLFKQLKYPFQISKSALFAVGSPHTWPSLLAALGWLVELLNYSEKAEQVNIGSHVCGHVGVCSVPIEHCLSHKLYNVPHTNLTPPALMQLIPPIKHSKRR